MEKLIKWFSWNHVAANFLMALVLLAGLVAWFQAKKEVFPETAFDAVVIQVPYPNATAEEVESGVIVPIEEAISELEGIKRVTSTAARNVGSVTVEVETGYEVRNVMGDIETRVDAIDNFAENIERPILEEVVANRQVMSIAVSADTDEKTLRAIGEKMRDGLLAHRGGKPEGAGAMMQQFLKGKPKITKVELASVRPYEISIEVSEDRLRQYGLSLGEVAGAVRRASLDLPSGSVRTESGEVLVRAVGKRYTAEDFRSVVVKTLPDGSEVGLEEIADVIDGFEDFDLSSTFNGVPAVLLNVYRVGTEDTLAVTALAKDYVEEVRGELPEGVEVAVWNDWSLILEGRLDLLTRNIMWGLLFVLLVLALFLRPSLAFLVALGIPVSFAGGMWLMPHLGVSINMISAFAFILVLGIVVDDAIVVGENVYSRMQGGEHPKEASWKGTHEVGVVVIFGVLTTAMAFTPMLGLSGVSGKIWPNIPLVVIPVLMFSLVQSKLVLPAHLALLRPSSGKRSWNPLIRVQQAIARGLEVFVERVYTPVLNVLLQFRYVVLAGFLSLVMIAVTLAKTGWIPWEFFPKVEGEVLSAKIEMPLGAPFSETENAVKRIEAAAKILGEEFQDADGNSVLVNSLATSGMQPFQSGFAPGFPTGSHLGEVTIELVAAKNRPGAEADRLKVRWQELVGEIPGAVELSFKAETAAGGNAIDVNLIGAGSGEIEEAARWATEKLADYEGVIEISNSNRMGREELRVREINARGKAMGLDLMSVMSQVRDAFYGNEVQRLQRGRDEVKVMVRYPEDERRSLRNFETMKVRTPSGGEVPIGEVLEPEYGRGPATITRTDRFRTIAIKADVDRANGYNANEIVGRYTEEVLEEMGQKFPGVRYSFEGEQSDQRDSMREMMIGFVGALIAMYVLMAIALKSYIQPVIVMFVIPFGIVGAIAGHLFMGMNLSIMSMCGIVALAGVVVNDSLVLVDYVNRNRALGVPVREAARKAGARRFRPILLTSLTTFVGLVPMLRETDMQAKFLIPMAVSLGFGILFATMITLILLPALYLILEDVKRLVRVCLGRGWEEPVVEVQKTPGDS